MIHMAAEVVILLGVIVYFNQKNRKLSNQIEDLIQRVEEQEDIIQKHEQLIQQISTYLSTLKKPTPTPSPHKPVIRASPRKQPEVTFETKLTSAPVITRSPINPAPAPAPVITRSPINPAPAPAPAPALVLTPIPENEIDLDSEIQDELNELDEEELEVLDNEEAQKNVP